MQVKEGFHRFEIPTCLPVGEVNVYLFEGPKLTLVDTGPKIPEAYDTLIRELRKLNLSIKDIGRVLITHGHVDHHGLAEVIRRESNAEILAPEGDAEIVKDFEGAYEQKREDYRDVFLKTGIRPETLELVEGYFEYLASLAEATPVVELVRDGDLINAGPRQLKAIHTPGHSPGSMCYLDTDGCLISGDTLIKDVVPVAAFGSSEGKSIGLSDYLSSVAKLEKLNPTSVRPGHRAEFKDIPSYAALVNSQFESRQAAILQVLRTEPSTACDLVDRLFGILAIQDIFLALTEVLGHLEILAAESKIKCVEKDGFNYYSVA